MQSKESQQASIAVVSGLSSAQQEMLVGAINRAKGHRFAITKEMLAVTRFGTMCWACRREYDKTKNPEYLKLLERVVDLGLKSAI
jgi:hypothetical protein